MQGDLPPPCRAHSTTRVGCKIVIVGGGEDASYCNSVRLRHPATPLVAHDVHDHRRSGAAPRAHHGVLPEQNTGIRVAKTCCRRWTMPRSTSVARSIGYAGSRSRCRSARGPRRTDIIRPIWCQMSRSSLEVASASESIDVTIVLVVPSLKERHSFREGLLIASNGFLRGFTDATNHVPPHRRTQSVLAFSRLALHPDSSYLQ